MGKPLGPPPAKRTAARQPSAVNCLLCRLHRDFHPRNPKKMAPSSPSAEPQITPPASHAPVNFPAPHFFVPGNQVTSLVRIQVQNIPFLMKAGDVILQVLPSHIVVYRPVRSY